MKNSTYQAIFDQIQTGQLKIALDLIAEELQKSDNDPHLLYYAGLAHRRLNNYEEASKCYRQSIATDWNNPSAHLGLGIIYQLQGLYDKAIDSLKSAIDLDKDFPEAHNSLGLTYKSMGQYQQALDSYNKGAEAIVNMAFSQFMKDKENNSPFKMTSDGKNVLMMTPEAMEGIQGILKSNLMWAINRNNIGVCLAAVGDIEGAKRMFEESISFIPEGVRYDSPYTGLRDLADG
jgi:tetratricopeptide (TPR) repeat protein